MSNEEALGSLKPKLKPPDLNPGSNELKFMLPEEKADAIIEWARARVPADPHAGPDTDTYRVTTLYLDSQALGVYHRLPNYRRSKYRVRRYGTEELLYLEEKRKVRGWVRKRRTLLPVAELPRLGHAETEEWAGAWFHQLIERKQLAPQCQTTYLRLARVGETEGLPIRLTIDRRIRCAPQPDLALPTIPEKAAVAMDRTILELKYQKVLPCLFEELIREFDLKAESSSKYRLAIWLSGMAITAPEERQ